MSVFSQEKYSKHIISEGDNISIIAQKYGVKIKDITKANPNSPKILKLKSVLLIPNKNQKAVASKKKETPATNAPGSYVVETNDTFWGIAKKYNVSVNDLKKANPILDTENLRKGQQINIPSKALAESAKPAENIEDLKAKLKPEEVEVVREVLPKETKYAIAKEFGISVKELEKQNPAIKKRLKVGSMLKVRIPKEKAEILMALKTTPELKEPTSTPEVIAENPTVVKDTSTVIRVSNHSDLINQLIESATQNIGIRYRSGGTTRAGYDCSGLMISTFNGFDIKLPRSSIEQSRIGMRVSADEAQRGDLIFFKTNGRRRINHVGMVVEVTDGEIKFVHSATHGGVMISSTKEAYYGRNFSQVNRILK
ncbi:C40 family peptidase [Flavobacterium poyangense]|uniref:C40 family peptidase n=1 Tax=Flavobacterium poyangense TaxID=2204302 RepID=UPI001FB8BA8E|nr:C40 family peptidase [Flavobacterium sp. JXAS1]